MLGSNLPCRINNSSQQIFVWTLLACELKSVYRLEIGIKSSMALILLPLNFLLLCKNCPSQYSKVYFVFDRNHLASYPISLLLFKQRRLEAAVELQRCNQCGAINQANWRTWTPPVSSHVGCQQASAHQCSTVVDHWKHSHRDTMGLLH